MNNDTNDIYKDSSINKNNEDDNNDDDNNDDNDEDKFDYNNNNDDGNDNSKNFAKPIDKKNKFIPQGCARLPPISTKAST